MLERSEPDKFDHVVSWTPLGNGFKVHDPAAFVRDVLPRFFRQTKYKSFQRQCNIWGFERWLHGPDKGGYWHTNLVRGKAHLCSKMKRQKIKGNIGGNTATTETSTIERSVSVSSHSSGGSNNNMDAVSAVPSTATHTRRSISPSSPIMVGIPFTSALISTDSLQQHTLKSSTVSAFHQVPISPVPATEDMDSIHNEILSSGPPPQTGDCVGFEGQHFFFIGDDEYQKDKQEKQDESNVQRQRRLSFNLFAACREESDAALVEMLVAEASPTAEFSLTSSSYFY
jgi:hypothetical protein